MLVKRTLHEIHSDFNDLKELRSQTGRMLGDAIIGGRKRLVDKAIDEYRQLDDMIKYMSNIEVEYEDKYEAAEVEE